MPFVEPFAWTRPGAPFQAYSWAIELLYFELIEHFGPMGLNVLQGLIYVALAAVMVVLGKAARWNPWVIAVMVAGNLIVTLGATPYVRPQSVLLIVTPIIWALVYRSLDTERLDADARRVDLRQRGPGKHPLVVSHRCGAVRASADQSAGRSKANPPRSDRNRDRMVHHAVRAALVRRFRLNFAPNALFGPPTGINE